MKSKCFAVGDSTLTVLNNANETYPAMIAALKCARKTIYFGNFCMTKGKAFKLFVPLLESAARRGVDVRLLLDGYGSANNDAAQLKNLRSAGVKITWFRPLNRRNLLKYNRRFHKKLLIIDAEMGFTGGIGVGIHWLDNPHYPQPWRDTHFQVTGTIVSALAQSFVQSWNDWSAEQMTAQAYTASNLITPVNSYRVAGGVMVAGTSLLGLFNNARQSITITTAYFGPPVAAQKALFGAAARGVTVRILTNGPFGSHKTALAAGRHLYARFLAHNIRLYEYQPTKLHAKLFLIDGEAASIGSANLNTRSFYHDEEFNLIVRDQAFTRNLEKQFDDDLRHAIEIEPIVWAQRPRAERARQALLSSGRRYF